MKYTLLGLLLYVNIIVYSQEANNFDSHFKNDTSSITRQLRSASGSYLEIPRMIPPSPEISAIFKFIDNPVSHSTGIADINIPLYTINCGDIKLPISINYHSGGRKFTDMTGAVGLGWVLNAGGTISRTVFGVPDEEAPVPLDLKESKSLSIKNDYDYLAGFYYKPGDSRFGKRADSEYDIFSYSLPGLSDNFVLYNSHPYSLTLNSVKIEMGGSNADNFTIIDENGTKYIFKDSETSSIYAPDVYGYNTKTAWHLSEIHSADEKHVVRFTYETIRLLEAGNNPQCTLVNECLFVKDLLTGSCTSGVVGTTVDSKFDYMLFSFTSKRLKEIDFGTGKVIFDIEKVGGKINKMYVKNVVGEVVKSYDFTYSFLDKTLMNNYKLDKLTSISGTERSETYDFEYYPTSASFNSRQCDYWGYINDSSSSSVYCIPVFEIYINGVKKTAGHYGISREPNASKAQSGVLKKIIYPTGGSTEYIYEGNKYIGNGGSLRDGPGLRIKQIKTMDSSANTLLRTFEYNGNRGGDIMLVPDMRYCGFESFYLDMAGSINYPTNSRYYGHYRQRVFSSEIPPEVSFYGNQPVFYYKVIEYRGDKNSNTGKTEFTYSNPNSDSYLFDIPWPSYPVSSYPSYYPPLMPKSFESDSNSRYYKYIYQFGSLWKDRNLTYQVDYSRVGNEYKAIKSTSYSYNEITATPLKGLKIFKYIQVMNDSSQSVEEFLAKDFGMPVFLFSTYYITRGRQLLSSITETDYRGDNSADVNVITKSALTYNSNFLLNEESVVNSSGIYRIQKHRYSSDDEYNGLSIYEQMRSRNMLNIPVQHIVEQNEKVRSQSIIYDDCNGIIKPVQIIQQKTGGEAEVRIRYHRYDDYGNPIFVTKDEVTKIVYIWGYGGQYPVAEIKNATYDEVKLALGCTPESLSSSLTYDYRIENLRTHIGLSHSQVTIYKYKPLVGLIEMINERGVSIFYDYDSFGRLKKTYLIHENCPEIIEQYEYHTVN